MCTIDNSHQSAGFTTTVAGAGSAPGLPWMASKTSCRCTGTSLGATMPSRTLSPRISTTVTVMSLLMTMLSFFFLDSTSIGTYPFPSPEAVPVVGFLHTPVDQRTMSRPEEPEGRDRPDRQG